MVSLTTTADWFEDFKIGPGSPSGGYFVSPFGVRFKAYRNTYTFNSAVVDADGSGDLTFELWGYDGPAEAPQDGTQLETKTETLSSGENTISLGWDIVGGDYRDYWLGVTDDTLSPQLLRTDQDIGYPFTDADRGLIAKEGVSFDGGTTADRWYFLFDLDMDVSYSVGDALDGVGLDRQTGGVGNTSPFGNTYQLFTDSDYRIVDAYVDALADGSVTFSIYGFDAYSEIPADGTELTSITPSLSTGWNNVTFDHTVDGSVWDFIWIGTPNYSHTELHRDSDVEVPFFSADGGICHRLANSYGSATTALDNYWFYDLTVEYNRPPLSVETFVDSTGDGSADDSETVVAPHGEVGHSLNIDSGGEEYWFEASFNDRVGKRTPRLESVEVGE